MWVTGLGGSDIVPLNKEMVTNQDATGLTRMYIFISPLLKCALVYVSAPKPEDGETGEDFFERVGGISQRVNSMLNKKGKSIQYESILPWSFNLMSTLVSTH